ncbi:Coiled-coil domain-containing protein 47 [Dinochytrium kinnereticum]|nr:Coiled-coil domain-containing protein 47 [Dinochytrium kinnereticum]
MLAAIATASSSDDDVEDVEDVDDDEPIATKSAWSPPLATPGSSQVRSQQLNWGAISIWDFQFEMVAVIGLAVYLALHYYGRSVNLGIAKKWLQATLPVWESNFSQVGDDKKYTMIRDGPNDFIFYASGRRHVQRVYGFIRLLPRFDLVGYLKNITVPDVQQHDKVVINITLDKSLQGLVFAILPKRTSAKTIKSRYDLADFAIPKTYPRFPKEQYVLLTDAPDFAATLMEDERFVSTLWASVGLNEKGEGKLLRHPVIESIILTDQEKVLPKSIEGLKDMPKTLSATFLIPPNPTEFDTQLMIDLVSSLMDLIEYLAQYPFTTDAKSKLKKIRTAAEDKIMKKLEEARKEELAKMKQEALKKKEQEVSKMSPEEQRKWEEKKQKLEMKKRMKKGKVTM